MMMLAWVAESSWWLLPESDSPTLVLFSCFTMASLAAFRSDSDEWLLDEWPEWCMTFVGSCYSMIISPDLG